MNPVFEELDYQETTLGMVSLRRRTEPMLDNRVLYEVKLDDEFLMSSLFTEAESQLACLGLAAAMETYPGDELDIIVGGLGLGYTAAAVLQAPLVKTLGVIEILQPVINWHEQGLVPLGSVLTEDPRCHLVHADFFQRASDARQGFIDKEKSSPVHAVLLDIDHSPSHLLNPENKSFYTSTGLHHLSDKLHEGGVFGLWSNDPPDEGFTRVLESVFPATTTHVVTFANPYTGDTATNTVYISKA